MAGTMNPEALSAKEKGVMRAYAEVEGGAADVVGVDLEMFAGLRGIVAIVAAIELDEAVGGEVLLEKVNEGVVIGLLKGGIVFGVLDEILDGRVVGLVLHSPQPTSAANDQFDGGAVRQGEFVDDGRVAWVQGIQGDARRRLVPGCELGLGFRGQEGHEAYKGVGGWVEGSGPPGAAARTDQQVEDAAKERADEGHGEDASHITNGGRVNNLPGQGADVDAGKEQGPGPGGIWNAEQILGTAQEVGDARAEGEQSSKDKATDAGIFHVMKCSTELN